MPPRTAPHAVSTHVFRPTPPARPWRGLTLLLAAAVLLPAGGLAACEHKPKVKLIRPEDAKAAAPERKTEEALREEHDKRVAARENAPEPKLNPNDPREKLELIWRMGESRLDSIYTERADMLDKVKHIPALDPSEQKVAFPLAEKMAKFGVPRDPEGIEAYPDELCALVREVRVPAKGLIDKGTEQLKLLADKTKALDAKADAGGTVSQRQWDKLEKETKRWSAPALAGRHLLLMVRNLLDEAYIVANLGARRVQIKLRDCLGELAKEPLPLDLAQEALEKALARAKWYRDLR